MLKPHNNLEPFFAQPHVNLEPRKYYFQFLEIIVYLLQKNQHA